MIGVAQRKAMTPEELRTWLEETLAGIIRELEDAELGIREGKVMTSGEAPYRRLDCDGRAIAYLRSRPKKRAVRVDVTGLWKTPRSSKIRVPNAGGAATLLIRTSGDARLAVRFLRATVERTRARRRTEIETRA